MLVSHSAVMVRVFAYASVTENHRMTGQGEYVSNRLLIRMCKIDNQAESICFTHYLVAEFRQTAGGIWPGLRMAQLEATLECIK